MVVRLMVPLALAVVLAACGGAEAKSAAAGAVDSVESRDTSIARFQRSVPQVATLGGGARGRDQLVLQFVTALEKSDTSALRSLVLTKSEFGWLYYPTNPQGFAPYNLTPQLMWFMVEGNSAKGYGRLLQRFGGTSLHYRGYRCDGKPGHEGKNTVWGPCVVIRKGDNGETVSDRLFGQIVERDGRYKFVSYSNKL